MQKINILSWVPVVIFAAVCMYFAAGAAPQITPDGQTGAMVTATMAFLNSLTPAQREKVQFPFTPQKTATAATFSRGNVGRGAGGGPQGGPGRPGGDAGRGRGPGVAVASQASWGSSMARRFGRTFR
jgi:hypothetical protein